MEIVFWAAVAFMMLRGNTNLCVGASCVVGWVVVVLAGILRYVSLLLTYLRVRLMNQSHVQISCSCQLPGLAILQEERVPP
jgi:hypothetical protein